MEGKNSAYTKLYNRRRVLSLLQRSPLSRAELSRQMGLTRAAISLITEELIAEGLICQSQETIHAAGPGRAPIALKLCSGARYAVGVSLSRSGALVGIEDLCGTVITQKPLTEQTPEGLICAIRFLIRDLPKDKILGIGISSPGPVDPQSGTILNPPGFPHWSNCPIGTLLEKALGLTVYLEKDANAAALYNRRNGDFPEKDDFLLLYMSGGVGSSIISQGRLLRFCELGHTSICHDGPLCSCGNRGCLEVYASIGGIIQQFDCDNWEDLMASPQAEQALALQAEYLATAIGNCSNMVPIGAVLLDGKMQKYSAQLLPLVAQKLAGRCLSGQIPRLLPALSSSHTRLQSACSIVFSHYLEEE